MTLREIEARCKAATVAERLMEIGCAPTAVGDALTPAEWETIRRCAQLLREAEQALRDLLDNCGGSIGTTPAVERAARVHAKIAGEE